MASKINIINLALYKMAQSVTIPSIDDQSKAADVMKNIYDIVRDMVLEARVWPWAIKVDAASPSPDNVFPGWAYRYDLPNDCLTLKAVTDANGLRQVRTLSYWGDSEYLQRNGLTRYLFDFQTSNGLQATVIDTDIPEAYLVYVARVEDTNRYSATFVNAFAARLAAEAAPAIIGDAGISVKRSLMDEYAVALTEASSNALNQSSNTGGFVSPAVQARGG